MCSRCLSGGRAVLTETLDEDKLQVVTFAVSVGQRNIKKSNIYVRIYLGQNFYQVAVTGTRLLHLCENGSRVV